MRRVPLKPGNVRFPRHPLPFIQSQMPPTPPPPNVENWPSHIYWRETDARVKQLWYVSFCLMMSSVQDRLTGLSLRESGNLNWSTTAFYYSAVHAGRLLCFVCTGDYPTGHAELASLLSPSPPAPPNPPRRFHFDWLDKFKRYVGTPAVPAPGVVAAPPRPDLEAIQLAIDAHMPALRASFDQFAPLLAKFKNLRNDCNYEALLVAHEVNHFTVTDGFRELVTSADRASSLAVDLATGAYLAHLRGNPCFEPSRVKFHAAHDLYLDGRFGLSLQTKFGTSHTAMGELHRITESLRWPGAEPVADIENAFLSPIMYDTFGEKQGLMRRWRDDINELKASLPSL